MRPFRIEGGNDNRTNPKGLVLFLTLAPTSKRLALGLKLRIRRTDQEACCPLQEQGERRASELRRG